MLKIKFGTDGWRAIIAREYTVDNVRRVAAGTVDFMKKNGMSKVVIGYDCRFGGLMFAEETARVIGSNGITVFFDDHFTTTPMVSLGARELGADLGVVITASHNPPSYNGYKLKSSFGGPSIPSEIAQVEEAIPDVYSGPLHSIEELRKEGSIKSVDLHKMYRLKVEENFDLDLIRNSGIGIAYDAMYGAGQRIMKELLPDCKFLHCEYNPSFMGQAPEPIHKNLSELSETLSNSPELHVGIANDGDADRIGMYDENGNFVDSHHMLLLLLIYLGEYKKMDGKVVVSFSVTDRLETLAHEMGLEFEVTKIGFKYIAEIMRHQTVIVGGEESGGLTVAGHIPERDGIWTALLLLEYMCKTGKSLLQLIDDLYQRIGSFSFDRDDLKLKEELKQEIIANCKNGVYKSFGDYQVEKVDDLDGYKFFLGEGRWLMIRPSGTEPLLRVYCQANSSDEVRLILDSAAATIL